uniref:Uncharacterized protein n=1 Tax=Anguilla anguilla TaxID=7936 RepID=A0A0E9P6W1_ANGAN
MLFPECFFFKNIRDLERMKRIPLWIFKNRPLFNLLRLDIGHFQ